MKKYRKTNYYIESSLIDVYYNLTTNKFCNIQNESVAGLLTDFKIVYSKKAAEKELRKANQQRKELNCDFYYVRKSMKRNQPGVFKRKQIDKLMRWWFR